MCQKYSSPPVAGWRQGLSDGSRRAEAAAAALPHVCEAAADDGAPPAAGRCATHMHGDAESR